MATWSTLRMRSATPLIYAAPAIVDVRNAGSCARIRGDYRRLLAEDVRGGVRGVVCRPGGRGGIGRQQIHENALLDTDAMMAPDRGSTCVIRQITSDQSLYLAPVAASFRDRCTMWVSSSGDVVALTSIRRFEPATRACLDHVDEIGNNVSKKCPAAPKSVPDGKGRTHSPRLRKVARKAMFLHPVPTKSNRWTALRTKRSSCGRRAP
jgi:hypothetical protein